MAQKIKRYYLYIMARYKLLKNPLKFVFYEKNGKRYLVVLLVGLRGVKINRRFEIVSEVDKSYNHIAFKGRKVDDCIRQPSEN